MFDIIEYAQYRIPGEAVTRKEGKFYELKPGEPINGFIVTDFTGEKQYVLRRNKEDWMPQFRLPPRLDETHRNSYFKSGKAFKKSLEQTGGKAVLSRIKKVELQNGAPELFDDLCDAYPNAFVYEFSHSELGRWIGATPETLLIAENGKGKTMALAGTRLSESEEPWSAKEFEEHEYVADFIEDSLVDDKVVNVNRSQRTDIISGPVKHLLTEFEFDVDQADVWNLARKLHPTPAVSGWPIEMAMNLINKYEHHDRHFYTGIVGVIGEKTNLYVNLRCARNDNDSMYLFLGGGFTKDSDIEAEWNETENKAATLINVLKNG
ncbi:MAG: chorismate-binding protein [Crocinitomicaceae bacterium]